MDFEDAMEIAFAPLLVLAYAVSLAALAWGCGWSWWWAVPVSIPPAVVAALIGCSLVASCVNAADWLEDRRVYRAYVAEEYRRAASRKNKPRPKKTAAPKPRTDAKYLQLKRALAKITHPDFHSDAGDAERALREAVFKEVWAEVERIDGR